MASEGSNQPIVELLSEILRWTKIGALNLKESLAQELPDDRQRLVYELSDGDRSSTEVANLSGVPQTTISRLWRHWRELGFVDLSPRYQGRVQHLCSLSMLGIPIPDVPSGSKGVSIQQANRRRRRPVIEAETEEPTDQMPETSEQE